MQSHGSKAVSWNFCESTYLGDDNFDPAFDCWLTLTPLPLPYIFRVLSGPPCWSMQITCCLSVVLCVSEFFILKLKEDHPLKLVLGSLPGVYLIGLFQEDV